MPIQIPNKAAVVSLTVVRPRTGRAFIDGAGQQRLPMEFIHLLLAGREKADVRAVAGEAGRPSIGTCSQNSG